MNFLWEASSATEHDFQQGNGVTGRNRHLQFWKREIWGYYHLAMVVGLLLEII